MYITINNIKGESRIDLSYSIQNFDSDKEITVIRMLTLISMGGGHYGPPIIFPQYLWNDLS